MARAAVASGCRILSSQEPCIFFNKQISDTDFLSWDVSVTSLLFREKGQEMSLEFDYGLCWWRIIFVYEREWIRVCLRRKKVDEGPDAIRLNFTVDFTVNTHKVVHKNCLFLRSSAPRTCFFLHRGHLPNTVGSHGLSDMITFTCRFLDWKEEELLPKMHTDKAQEENADSKDDDYDQEAVPVISLEPEVNENEIPTSKKTPVEFEVPELHTLKIPDTPEMIVDSKAFAMRIPSRKHRSMPYSKIAPDALVDQAMTRETAIVEEEHKLNVKIKEEELVTRRT